MSDPHDIFTPRGITPGGPVARAQRFARYEGADWHERRNALTRIDPNYGLGHPDPADALHARRSKLLDRMLGPRSRAAREYDGPTYDDAYLEVRPFNRIQERRSYKTQARLHFEATGEAPDDVLEALEALDPAEVARQSWEGWLRSALAVDGWAMPRHAALEGVSLMTQIRPDAEVNMGGGPAKYVYTPGRTAKGLGTNPLARWLPTWNDPNALFVFVLEGTLKMCAVVEAGYPAIDAGSVTLWGGGLDVVEHWEDGDVRGSSSSFNSDIERFAKLHLVGRPVAVVVDSDWLDPKKGVRLQSTKVTNLLNRAGARAVACAPPEPDDGRKLGVDDWLGEGRDVLELVYHERVGDAELTPDDQRLEGIRTDGRETVAKLLRGLGEAASSEGVALYAETELRKVTGRSKDSLQKARRHAEERGLLQELTKAKRYRGVDGSHGMEPGAVRVVPEALPKYRVRTLGDWLETLK